MQYLHLCLLLISFLLPTTLASEDCEAALAAAQREHSTLIAQLETEKRQVEELISVLKGKESDVELAKAALQGMEDDISDMDAEIKASRGREAKAIDMIHELRTTVKRLELKNEACDTCQSDLEISKGAEKQMEAELANAFARVQILSAESNQLTKMTDELNKKLEKMEQSAETANEKASAAESELEALKEQIAKSSQGSAAFLSEAVNSIYNQLPDLQTYWQSAQEYIQPGLEAANSNPALRQTLDGGKKFLRQAKTQASEIYSSTIPYVLNALESAQTYGSIAIQKTNDVYSVIKPVISLGMQMSKEYATAGYAGVCRITVQAMKALKDNSAALSNSQFVSDVKGVTATTLDELQNYIQGRMWQIQSLQPFAKKEYVAFVVYTMLSLPPLFITGILISCFGRAGRKQPNQAATPTAPAAPVTPAAKKKQTSKKSKKTGSG